MSGYDDRDAAALDRLEDMLNAYCEARLMPRGPVLSRIRANVLAEAAATAATAAAARRLHADAPRSALGRWTAQSPFARRAFALGFAAVLTVGTTAAVMGAPAGSPFYNARVYLESLILPAQLDARLAAHERHLDARIAEAEAAAARDDAVGLAAALAAYQSEVNAATIDVGDDAALLAHLEAVLTKHTDVLTALAARLPEQSSIEKAIEASSKAIDKIQAKGPGAHPTPRAPAAPQSQQQGPP